MKLGNEALKFKRLNITSVRNIQHKTCLALLVNYFLHYGIIVLPIQYIYLN